MKLSINTLSNYTLATKDNSEYKIKDILINEESWRIQYLKVDIGGFLQNNIILVPRFLIETVSFKNGIFYVDLYDSDIRNCPALESHLPISKLYEKKLDCFYQKEDYWVRHYYPPVGTPNVTHNCMIPADKIVSRLDNIKESEINSSLRSLNEILGYSIVANNGHSGTIVDFVVEDKDWYILSLVVKLKGRFGFYKKVFLARKWVSKIRYIEQSIFLDLKKSEIKESPRFSVTKGINNLFIKKDYNFRGKPVNG